MDLLKYKKNVTSQYGEDGILEKIFEILDIQKGSCVEFGAWDGKHYSNTWSLRNNYKWIGLLIESDTEKYKILKKNNPDDLCINKKITNNLDDIISKYPAFQNIDLMSIDIDGDDYYVWDKMKEYKPKVVVIEFNPTMPFGIDYIQSLGFNHGNSLMSLWGLAAKREYFLACCTVNNAIFIKNKYRDLFAEIEIDFSESNHLKINMFVGYDGILIMPEYTIRWGSKKIDKKYIQEHLKII